MLERRLASLLPAFLLALFTFGPGSFSLAGGGGGTTLGWISLLTFAGLGAARWRHPLGDGVVGSWLAAALVLVVTASWLASSVPRAGTTALLILPAFLLLPSAVARCWRGESARQWGLVGVAVVELAVVWAAGWGVLRHGDLRPSWPLGHHNLLAAWLLLTLPLVGAGLAFRSVWGRVLHGIALLGGVGLLLATGSMAGRLGLVVAIVVVTPRRWRIRAGLASCLPLAAVSMPRLSRMLTGEDPSLLARRGYLEAGWRGFADHWLLGMGPGTAPWTLPGRMVYLPGVNPAGELVADTHCLPLTLAYELGALGLVIAVGIGWVLFRRAPQRSEDPADRTMLLAARASLAGWGAASLGGAPLSVAALPLALALVAGSVLAASSRRPWTASRGPWWLVLVLAGGLVPSALGRMAWDRGARGGDPRNALETAVRWDSRFPLYRSRLSALTGDAEAARAAARDAPGVSFLWLRAGKLALRRGSEWAPEALARACRLDPLSGFAPFLLGASRDGRPEELARAFLAEPRLAAGVTWEATPGLLEATIAEVERWPGVELGWRDAMVKRLRSLPAPSGERARLRLGEDGTTGTSSSLFVFRRVPWPAEVAAVEVDVVRARHLDLVPAFALATTGPEALAAGCGPDP